MTEAEKLSQREAIEQSANKLEADWDVTARQIADNTGRKAIWTFFLGLVVGSSVGALTVGTLASNCGLVP
jgi:hypothetical protein